LSIGGRRAYLGRWWRHDGVVGRDLKACDDESGLGYVARLQFRKCMDPRGYAVTSRD
jgi:hypothetical protein